MRKTTPHYKPISRTNTSPSQPAEKDWWNLFLQIYEILPGLHDIFHSSSFCSSFFCLKGHFWADLKLPNIRSNTSFRCLANIGKCILKDQWRTVAVNWIQLAPKRSRVIKDSIRPLDHIGSILNLPKRRSFRWHLAEPGFCCCEVASVKWFRCPEMLHATWEHQVKLRHSVHNHGTFQRGAWREGTFEATFIYFHVAKSY